MSPDTELLVTVLLGLAVLVLGLKLFSDVRSDTRNVAPVSVNAALLRAKEDVRMVIAVPPPPNVEMIRANTLAYLNAYALGQIEGGQFLYTASTPPTWERPRAVFLKPTARERHERLKREALADLNRELS